MYLKKAPLEVPLDKLVELACTSSCTSYILSCNCYSKDLLDLCVLI